LNDTGESAGKSSGRHVWDLQNTHMGIHVGQYNNFEAYLSSVIYRINHPIPKHIFNKRYPKYSITFGDRLKIQRLNAGLMIKELTEI
jgi:hypothetical protein